MKEQVEKLISEELERANKKFPLFNSPHEGAAVILEELDEVEGEYTASLESYSTAWKYIKLKGGQDEAKHYIKKLGEHAARLAEEAIQVAAMADKYMLSMEKKEG